MRTSSIFKYALSITAALLFMSASCNRCETREPRVAIVFIDLASNEEIRPENMDARAINRNEPLAEFSENQALPLDLNSDTTAFILTQDGQSDTLFFVYGRDLQHEGGKFCLELQNVSGFSPNYDFVDVSIRSNNNLCTDCNYEAVVYLD